MAGSTARRWACRACASCIVWRAAFLLAGLSATGGLWNHEVHAVGLMIALPLAIVALVRGVRLHRRHLVGVLGGGGLALMTGSLLLGHGTGAEVAMSVCGVLMLAVAHLLNLRWSRH